MINIFKKHKELKEYKKIVNDEIKDLIQTTLFRKNYIIENVQFSKDYYVDTEHYIPKGTTLLKLPFNSENMYGITFTFSDGMKYKYKTTENNIYFNSLFDTKYKKKY